MLCWPVEIIEFCTVAVSNKIDVRQNALTIFFKKNRFAQNQII